MSRIISALIVAGLAIAPVQSFAFTGTFESWRAPKPDLMEAFVPFAAGSTEVVSHNRWEAFLATYLDVINGGPNLFRYGAVNDRDREILDEYIASLEAVGVSLLDRPEQKAFWINLYNALTVRTVLEHYPVNSIRDIRISPGLFSSGPWGAKLVTIEGVELSLDDIEHRILRPIWEDNRIHYVLNCAALGCPDLRPEAFTPLNIDRIMDEAAFNFINLEHGVSVDSGRMTVSKIYEWFDEDFGGTDEGVLAHILEIARAPLQREINRRIGLIKTRYDWWLNDADQSRNPTWGRQNSDSISVYSPVQ